MAVNVPEVHLLSDTGKTTIVKIVGYYNATTTGDTKVITANALSFSNTTYQARVSISKIQYAVDMAAGSLRLEWQGSTNSVIAAFGTASSGVIDAYIPNNAAAATGDINLRVDGAASNDAYTIVMTLNKETGYTADLLYV